MNFSNMKYRNRLSYVACCIVFVFIVDYFGLLTHFREADFSTEFKYPLEGDVKKLVTQVRSGKLPEIAPINIYNYTYLHNLSTKCKKGEAVRLVILVKSAVENFERRQAVRNSWGFERRFSDVIIKTVFFVGMVKDTDLLMSLLHERETYNDVVHLDFEDTYYNNTIKTMCAFRWAIESCSNATFYLFSDDDMYVSTKNVLRFVRNPTNYPTYLETPGKIKYDPYKLELAPDVVMFAGYVFESSPLRHKSSKWYVTLDEYPFDKWPPYVTAGAYIVSREALHQLYYTSMFTKHFRFDDIFLGIVAKKADIQVFHSNEFYFYHKPYTRDGYRYVIASHGFDKPNELLKIWNDQRSAGNA